MAERGGSRLQTEPPERREVCEFTLLFHFLPDTRAFVLFTALVQNVTAPTPRPSGYGNCIEALAKVPSPPQPPPYGRYIRMAIRERNLRGQWEGALLVPVQPPIMDRV